MQEDENVFTCITNNPQREKEQVMYLYNYYKVLYKRNLQKTKKRSKKLKNMLTKKVFHRNFEVTKKLEIKEGGKT